MGWVSINYRQAPPGSAGGGLPNSSGDDYAPLVEHPAGTGVFLPAGVAGEVVVDGVSAWEKRRLIVGVDVDPPFEILTFTKTGPSGSTALFERGQTVTASSYAATYEGGPPSAASGTHTVTAQGGPATDDLAFDAMSGPGFASLTSTGGVTLEGLDAGADPYFDTRLDASLGSQSDSATHRTLYTSRVFYGASANTSLTEAQIEALASNVLRTSRAGSYAMTLSSQYGYMCWPDTYGTPTVTQGGFPSAWSKIGTVSVTNAYGVTRTYGVWRSDGLLTGTLTFVVT